MYERRGDRTRAPQGIKDGDGAHLVAVVGAPPAGSPSVVRRSILRPRRSRTGPPPPARPRQSPAVPSPPVNVHRLAGHRPPPRPVTNAAYGTGRQPAHAVLTLPQALAKPAHSRVTHGRTMSRSTVNGGRPEAGSSGPLSLSRPTACGRGKVPNTVSAGEPSSVGSRRRPSRSPRRPLTAGQPCPEQPCQPTQNRPGRDQPDLFSLAWLTGHREVPAPGPQAPWGRGGGPGGVGRAEAEPRCRWLPWLSHPCSSAVGSDPRSTHVPAVCHRPRYQPEAPNSHSSYRATCPARPVRVYGSAPSGPESRVWWYRTALTPEPGPAALLRTPRPDTAPQIGPGRILAFRSGNGPDFRLTADCLLTGHPCDQLRLFH